MEKKCAVFSCLGLGDGLLALILSHNLHLNGHSVTTFHPHLSGLQPLFPHLPLSPFPPLERLEEYEQFFIFYEKSPWMNEVISFCLSRYPEKTRILNPIATPNRDYPYWSHARFDGQYTLVQNLYLFCKDVLQLPRCTRFNGILPPSMAKHPQRVLLHPTSSRPGKNWPKEKYLLLAEALKKRGFDPVFILSPQEKGDWPEIDSPLFPSLADLAAFVAASGSMIGNDSGIGHLASCLGLFTLTICRNKNTAQFWRPDWSKGEVLFPSPLIPNLKGLRLRDKYWKRWISVNKVLSTFLKQSIF